MGRPPLGDTPSYLPADAIIPYWTTLSGPALVASAGTRLGGALVIAVNRSVLTSGVMMALALIPAAATVGMGLASGDLGLAGKGRLRWAIDLGLLTGASLWVLAWKRSRVQQRTMMFYLRRPAAVPDLRILGPALPSSPDARR